MVYDTELVEFLGFFPSYVLKYSMLSVADRFGLRLQAHFFQSNCHYMIIIYTVIKHVLTSN
jgi:hypothetical protein